MNEFARALGPVYAAAPKEVLAAIAVSSLTVGGGFLAEAGDRAALEWERLHAAGVVAQPLPKALREAARRERVREDEEGDVAATD